jgi:hypothetical protein
VALFPLLPCRARALVPPPFPFRPAPQVVYAVLGFYAGLVFIGKARSGLSKTNAIAAEAPPSKPDFTTPVAKSSDIPSAETETAAWEAFVAAKPENFETWFTAGEAAPAAH